MAQNVGIRRKFPAFCEIDEGAYARPQKRVQLGLLRILGRPRVLAREEKGGGPVGVWYGADLSTESVQRSVYWGESVDFSLQVFSRGYDGQGSSAGRHVDEIVVRQEQIR
jgi:hypothetical protein